MQIDYSMENRIGIYVNTQEEYETLYNNIWKGEKEDNPNIIYLYTIDQTDYLIISGTLVRIIKLWKEQP